MAVITAGATGNWSATGTWVGGVVPGNGDTARTSTFTVTIDVDLTGASAVTLLEGTSSGHFAVTAARTITAAVTSSTGHSGGGVVRCTHTTGTVTITGAITAGLNVGVSVTTAGNLTIVGNVTAGTSTAAYGVSSSSASTGAVTINGNVTGGTTTITHGLVSSNASCVVSITGNVASGSASGGNGVNAANSVTIVGNVNGSGTVAVSNTGTTTVTGDVAGGASTAAHGLSVTGTTTVNGNVTGGGTSSSRGAYCTGATTITINGNVTGGTGTSAYGVDNGGSGTVTVTGLATGGSGTTAYGAFNSGTGTLRVNTAVGNDYGPLGGHSNPVPGLYGENATAMVTTYKKLKFGEHGQSPVGGAAYLEYVADTNTAQLYKTSSTYNLLTDPNDTVDYPVEANVRNATVYANATKTGTAYIPAASSVAYGVNVDATTGTAVLTSTAVTNAVWDAATSGHTTSGTFGEQAKTDIDAILADTGTDGVVLSTAQMQALADIVLGRSVSGIDNTASTHSLYELIEALLESSMSGTTWTIKKTNGSTTFNTRTLTQDANAVPIVGVA